MSTCLPYSKIVGYSSFAESAIKSGSDLERLTEFTSNIPIPFDILAEESDPGDNDRLMWREVIHLIGDRAIKMLIVSSIYDIAGADIARLSGFLKFAHQNHVRVRFVNEQLDTRYCTRRYILERAEMNLLPERDWKVSKLNKELI